MISCHVVFIFNIIERSKVTEFWVSRANGRLHRRALIRYSWKKMSTDAVLLQRGSGYHKRKGVFVFVA